jgi:hypothetical protein
VSECGRTRQNNADLSVLAGLAVDLYKPGMLLDAKNASTLWREAQALVGDCGLVVNVADPIEVIERAERGQAHRADRQH